MSSQLGFQLILQMNIRVSKQLLMGWVLSLLLIRVTYWLETVPPKYTEFFEGDIALSYSVHDTVPYAREEAKFLCVVTNMSLLHALSFQLCYCVFLYSFATPRIHLLYAWTRVTYF